MVLAHLFKDVLFDSATEIIPVGVSLMLRAAPLGQSLAGAGLDALADSLPAGLGAVPVVMPARGTQEVSYP